MCPRADGVELRAKVVTIRRKRVGNQPSKGAPVRLPATLPALNNLRCYANLTSRTTSSRSDYTSGAGLRDLGNPGTLHIVYHCFKKDLDLYNSSDGTTVTVSLCSHLLLDDNKLPPSPFLLLQTTSRAPKVGRPSAICFR
jgi:hypothetical protein